MNQIQCIPTPVMWVETKEPTPLVGGEAGEIIGGEAGERIEQESGE
jgi:hypothetical protein